MLIIIIEDDIQGALVDLLGLENLSFVGILITNRDAIVRTITDSASPFMWKL